MIGAGQKVNRLQSRGANDATVLTAVSAEVTDSRQVQSIRQGFAAFFAVEPISI